MYKCKEFTDPIWRGNKVLYESFMPVKQPNDLSSELVVPLLYAADKILSVKSATLDREFIEGKDYRLNEEGKLVIPEGSEIKIMPWSVYNPATPPDSFAFICSLGGYLLFHEDGEFHFDQYVVTYEHHGLWQGPIPSCDPTKLPRIRKLLQDKNREVTIGFTGDSITFGCNSTSQQGWAPNVPIYPKMVIERLEELYDRKIHYVNTSIPGVGANVGFQNAQKDFQDQVPDLLVVAYGMNDATGECPVETYIANEKGIIDTVRKMNPECEIILLSTSLPNPIAQQFNKIQASYLPHLHTLADSYGEVATVADMTSLHAYIMTQKPYYDMTGNNINHPNDFFARIHAQLMLATISDKF